MKNTLLLTYRTEHFGAFANCKCEELSYPKDPKICDPILVTLLKMQPRYIQSGLKNATLSSGTSPLASYKELPLPLGQDLSVRRPFNASYQFFYNFFKL